MNRRQRLAQKWMIRMDDVLLPDWLDKWPKVSDAAYTVLFEWPCWLLGAHYAIPDHCMMPKHDHCAWCQKPMPNQADRR